MNIKISLILISILTTSLFAEIKGPIEKAYKNRYLKEKDHKAMYVAIDFNDGSWVYGYASNHVNKVQAEKAAKKYCKKEKIKHQINGSCKLYATGNRVLGF